MNPAEVLAAVEQRFAVTGADTPGWPDPWPDRDPPEEAYSQLLDPGKYRIVVSRLQAWADVLEERAGLKVESLSPREVELPDPADRLAQRVERWRPAAPGTLALLVAYWAIEGAADGVAQLAVARVGSGDPPCPLALVPDCGCDACDSGSADLLESLDTTIGHVVGGGLVHITTDAGVMWTTDDEGGAAGRGEGDLGLLAGPRDGLVERLPSGARVLSGAAWL